MIFFKLFFAFVLLFSVDVWAQTDVGSPVSVPPPIKEIKPVPQVLPSAALTIIKKDGGSLEFTVEVADDEGERKIGMMYRTEVPEGTGMLFIFDDVAERRFWMKDTYVPLDLLFINEDGTIQSIQHNAEPESLRILPSDGAVKSVLEIGGTVAAQMGIDVGDRVVYDVLKVLE